ncbi:hypothetical protein JHK85_000655 [Glycine max]|uniref:Uncharacterized protein n=2 Tax=Glycine subgen. Soja TaxID=1462606 RepID=K7K268_SOYBN|nr:hypothetical protein JHK87_000647 [Glycine soja]KAG5068278.1 hypothetical protein JHK85_000655 [Glycine max]KAG5088025.1 hypothetical protein JHK86_000637 [Glycine max]KAH1161875.1 hypothetical protein GYH30_000662 [Glycine max]RZC28747.1 Protein RETICULATA, chloroplastic [Glycine soja]
MKFKKRGKDFWVEFELYLADLLVGLVVNVALVGMLAPYARSLIIKTSEEDIPVPPLVKSASLWGMILFCLKILHDF